MLSGALINLLSNANRHTHNGIIDVQYQFTNGQICLTVSDNGEGISAELLPHVFDRGVSGCDSTGLGLAIVKSIMDMHNGEVSITSEVGKGTKVKLLFPGSAEGDRE